MSFAETKTPADIRDLWQTPQWLFDSLDREFNFDLDAAASAANCKVNRFITEAQDALSIDWLEHTPFASKVWLNPPYSDINPWMEKACEQMLNSGLAVVMLVPHTPDAAWWPRNASEIRVICGYKNPNGRNISGRIQFVRADTGEVQRGNNKGSCIIVFNPVQVGTMQTRYIGIETLMPPEMVAAYNTKKVA